MRRLSGSAPNLSVRYTTTATVNFKATDADGDAMSFSGVNLPGSGFVTLVDNGNGTASLTLSPATSRCGCLYRRRRERNGS